MELFTTVALFTVLIATLLLVLRAQPAAIKRGQAPTPATPATPTSTPKIVVLEEDTADKPRSTLQLAAAISR